MKIQNHYFIIRHGESENNVLEVESGNLKNKDQFGLTENGKKYTKKEAEKYRDFDVIFSSPFRRARETAEFFAQTSNCKIIEDVRIREVDVGDFELQDYKYVENFYKENSNDVPCPNGESPEDTKIRTIEFIEDINQKFKDKKILIVSHGYNVHQILKYLIKNFNWQEYLETHNNGRNVFEIGVV